MAEVIVPLEKNRQDGIIRREKSGVKTLLIDLKYYFVYIIYN